MKILVADDNEDNRHLLMDLLPTWGHEVVGVPDGDRAWAAVCGKDAPRLMVLDWIMPGIDGLQLCRKLRKEDTQGAFYIILLTSRTHPKDIVRALEAGADDYVTKPFNFDELRARIQAGCRILALQTKLREQERLQGILQMGAAVCHEMNQPLQVVLTTAQLLLKNISPKDPHYETLVTLKRGIERLGQVTRQVMRITHGDTDGCLGEACQVIDLSRPAQVAPSPYEPNREQQL